MLDTRGCAVWYAVPMRDELALLACLILATVAFLRYSHVHKGRWPWSRRD